MRDSLKLKYPELSRFVVEEAALDASPLTVPAAPVPVEVPVVAAAPPRGVNPVL